MKKVLTRVFLVLICLIAHTTTTFAHTSEKGGPISVSMHIAPYDQAEEKKKTSISFEVTDATNSFQKNLCDCVVEIKKDEKVLYTQPVFLKNTSSILYTFPSAGKYEIALIGTPKTNGEFSKFEVEFATSVVNPSTAAREKPMRWFTFTYGHSAWEIGFGVALLIICGIVLAFRTLRRKTSS